MIPIAWQEVCRLACGGCGGERNDSLFLDGRGVWRRPALEERLKLAEGFLDHVERRGSLLDGFSHFPIQAFDLICRRDAGLVRLSIDDDLKRIAFFLAGHGAAEHQAAGAIVAGR